MLRALALAALAVDLAGGAFDCDGRSGLLVLSRIKSDHPLFAGAGNDWKSHPLVLTELDMSDDGNEPAVVYEYDPIVTVDGQDELSASVLLGDYVDGVAMLARPDGTYYLLAGVSFTNKVDGISHKRICDVSPDGIDAYDDDDDGQQAFVDERCAIGTMPSNGAGEVVDTTYYFGWNLGHDTKEANRYIFHYGGIDEAIPSVLYVTSSDSGTCISASSSCTNDLPQFDWNLFGEKGIADFTRLVEPGWKEYVVEYDDDGAPSGDKNGKYLLGAVLARATEAAPCADGAVSCVHLVVAKLSATAPFPVEKYAVVQDVFVDWNDEEDGNRASLGWGGTPGSQTPFGGAYTFDGDDFARGASGQRVFFSDDQGVGVFELGLPISIAERCWNDGPGRYYDLGGAAPPHHAACDVADDDKAKPRLTWRAESYAAVKNDGTACPNVDVAIPETPAPAAVYYDCFGVQDGTAELDDCGVCGGLCGNQIFNPTSMCAYATVSTRGFLLCFENSTRAIDSSKNQPNRLRFDRARDF